jgi:dTDP-4-amino-4,6-dideoxygalactose transaminase
MVARRRELAAGYAKAVADIDGLRIVVDPAWGTSNFQSCWVEVLPDFPLGREELMAHLAALGISARRGIMAAHRQPAYAGRDTGDQPLPVTERLTDHTLILPLFHQMSESEQARVIDALRSARIAPASEGASR